MGDNTIAKTNADWDLASADPTLKALGHLAAIIASSSDAIVSKTLDGVVVSWNPGAEAIFGYAAAEIIGKSIRLLIPDDLQQEEDYVLAQIKRGERITAFDTIRKRKDGSLINVSLTISPIHDDKGEIIGIAKIAQDISRRKRDELSLKRSEAFARSVIEASPDCLKVMDLDGNLQFINANGQKLLELNHANKCIGMGWSTLWPAETRDIVRQAIADAKDGKGARFEASCETFGGRLKWWDVVVEPVLDETGRCERIISISRDITEKKNAEEARELLMREVSHRANNLLAVVQAVSRQTARETSGEAFADRLSERLQSLSTSQSLLIEGGWVSVCLHELIRRQLSFLGELAEHRLKVTGSDMRLKPQAVQGLGMAFHELATNAVKYGAYANDTGVVAITWQIDGSKDEPQFSLNWTEKNGLPVSEPERSGFGRTVIERMTAGAISGEVKMTFDPDGIRCLIAAPVQNLAVKG